MGSPTHKLTQSASRHSANEYAAGIVKGNRVMLSKAITLIESKLPSDQLIAEEVIQNILPHTGKSIRIGITGIPGVGKSTFIESFGKQLTSIGKKLAVLAIDPSSQRTQGSILGDKTRMDELSRDDNAFIRPTSASNALGGVAENTREAILLCEAAGFDVVIVETVGVGQSEITVRNMVDFFLLLLIGGAGDELQGIKKGIMEMADGVAITKADGDSLKSAKQAQADYQHALHMFPIADSGWTPKVLITSAIEKKGLNEVWEMIEAFKSFTTANGFFDKQRVDQNKDWFHSSIDNKLKGEILKQPLLKNKMMEAERQIEEGKISAAGASREIVNSFIQLMAANK